jgi:hypothetical protein
VPLTLFDPPKRFDTIGKRDIIFRNTRLRLRLRMEINPNPISSVRRKFSD